MYAILGSDSVSRLRAFHIVCAVLHFASMVAVPLYLNTVPDLEFYTPSMGQNTSTISVSYDLAATSPAYTLLVIFFGASVIEHSYCAFFVATYSADIVWPRWVSYSISAPVMIVTVAYAVGNSDLYALVSMAGLVFVMIGTGPLFDYMRRSGNAWIPLGCGFVPLVWVFSVIWASYPTDAPAFVAAIVWVISVLYFSFGFVPVVSLYTKEAPPYIRSELIYCFLSLSSKTLLGHIFGTGYRARFG